MKLKFLLILPALAVTAAATGQPPVAVGSASYASFPPAYKSKTDTHDGCRASNIESKQLWVDESVSSDLFDAASGHFTPNQPGTYRLTFACEPKLTATTYIDVVNLADANLALGCRAWASSSRGDDPSAVTDGLTTGKRWESEWKKDGEWIAVDLKHEFELTRVSSARLSMPLSMYGPPTGQPTICAVIASSSMLPELSSQLGETAQPLNRGQQRQRSALSRERSFAMKFHQK